MAARLIPSSRLTADTERPLASSLNAAARCAAAYMDPTLAATTDNWPVHGLTMPDRAVLRVPRVRFELTLDVV